jgi:hypothetical protein
MEQQNHERRRKVFEQKGRTKGLEQVEQEEQGMLSKRSRLS